MTFVTNIYTPAISSYFCNYQINVVGHPDFGVHVMLDPIDLGHNPGQLA
jgi:hypothetical protein